MNKIKYRTDNKDFKILNTTFHKEVVELRSTVLQNLVDPNICLPEKDEDKFLFENLCNEGITIGFFDQAKLAAIGILSFTSFDHPIIEKILKSKNIEYNKLALLNGSQVLEEYRGNGLQYELVTKRMELAPQHGIDLICATASPLNDVSNNNLLRAGLEQLATVEFYPNFQRVVYIKRLDSRLSSTDHK